MRQQIMAGLRKAGQGIQSFDDAYSAKIANMYQGSNPIVQSIAYLGGGAHPSFRKGQMVQKEYGPETLPQQMSREAMNYALPIANAVPKYVMPVAGVTMAGQALMDLTSGMMNQQTDSAIMPDM